MKKTGGASTERVRSNVPGAVWRNLVFNELRRIRKEWEVDEVPDAAITDELVVATEMYAYDLMQCILGREANVVYGDLQKYEPRSVEAYREELYALQEYVTANVEGKNPDADPMVRFDKMVAGLLLTCVELIDDRYLNDGDGGDGDGGDGDGDGGGDGDGDGGEEAGGEETGGDDSGDSGNSDEPSGGFGE